MVEVLHSSNSESLEWAATAIMTMTSGTAGSMIAQGFIAAGALRALAEVLSRTSISAGVRGAALQSRARLMQYADLP